VGNIVKDLSANLLLSATVKEFETRSMFARVMLTMIVAFFDSQCSVLFDCYKGELEDSVKLLVKVIRKASVVNSGLNFEVFLHKIDGIAEYERVDLLDGVSKLQKDLFLEAEMGDINLRSVL